MRRFSMDRDNARGFVHLAGALHGNASATGNLLPRKSRPRISSRGIDATTNLNSRPKHLEISLIRDKISCARNIYKFQE